MTKHTPTPYHTVIQTNQQTYETGAQYRAEIWANDADAEQPVALCVDGYDADFIVRAVNSHHELLAACKLIVEYQEDCFRCNATGKDPEYKRDACHCCGGTGKVIKDSITSEIHVIQQAIAKAEGK